MRITLLLCFRSRVNLLTNFVNFLLANTRHPESIEILVGIDSDDEIAKANMDYFSTMAKPMTMRFYIMERSEDMIGNYINPLARMASGRWVMVVNDDTEFITKDWDVTLDEAMAHKAQVCGDDIVLGLTDDLHGRQGEDPLYPHFTAWPAISKESIEALGYFFNPRFMIWGADHFIANVYRRVNRLVSLVTIKIDHNSGHNGRRPHDENHVRFCKIWDRYGFKFNEKMVEEDADKLIAYLKQKHGPSFEVQKGPLTIY